MQFSNVFDLISNFQIFKIETNLYKNFAEFKNRNKKTQTFQNKIKCVDIAIISFKNSILKFCSSTLFLNSVNNTAVQDHIYKIEIVF